MSDVQQATHWYRVNRDSFTADPCQADEGEVQRVGLHDCQQLGCEEIHAGSIFHYTLWLIQKYFGAGAHLAEGGYRS